MTPELEILAPLRNILIGKGFRYTAISTGWVLSVPEVEVYFSPKGTIYLNGEIIPVYGDLIPKVEEKVESLKLDTLVKFREVVGNEAFILYSISSMLALANTLDHHVTVVKEDPSGRLKALFLAKYQELKNKCAKFNTYFQSLFDLRQHDVVAAYSKQLYEINLCMGLMDPHDRDKVELFAKQLLARNYEYSKFQIEAPEPPKGNRSTETT